MLAARAGCWLVDAGSWLLAAGRMLAVRMETCRRKGGSEAAGELAASCWLLESWLLAGGCWSDAGCADGSVPEEGRLGGRWRRRPLAGELAAVVDAGELAARSDAGCADGNVPEDRRIGGCWRAGCKLLAAGELAAGWWMLESWLLAVWMLGTSWLERLIGGCWRAGC
jgi:hypothetical protein